MRTNPQNPSEKVKGKDGAVSREVLLDMYRQMLTTREFEETVLKYFSRGMIHGTCHACIGEEATSAGVLTARDPRDLVYGTHRGHGQAISFGMEPRRMMAEIFGKVDGYCKGKGGSMHIADVTHGYLGANGIVGGGIPQAVGTGLALKLQKREDTVCINFFGDGATNEGSFHESFNMAAAWNLPILFVCVNNTYGMSTHISKCMRETDIAKRAEAYGIPAATVDGNSFVQVYEAAKKARKAAVERGPYFLVLDTYRISGHSKSDANRYRAKEEIQSWKERCPILAAQRYLLENGIITGEEDRSLRSEAEAVIAEAVEFAMNSPVPSVETVTEDLFA